MRITTNFSRPFWRRSLGSSNKTSKDTKATNLDDTEMIHEEPPTCQLLEPRPISITENTPALRREQMQRPRLLGPAPGNISCRERFRRFIAHRLAAEYRIDLPPEEELPEQDIAFFGGLARDWAYLVGIDATESDDGFSNLQQKLERCMRIHKNIIRPASYLRLDQGTSHLI